MTTPGLNRVNSDFKATESRKIIKKQKINRIQFIKESANVCQKYKIKINMDIKNSGGSGR